MQIPRHYYVIDWVQFCDNRDVTVNGQWRGFGAGTCQASNDLQQFKGQAPKVTDVMTDAVLKATAAARPKIGA